MCREKREEALILMKRLIKSLEKQGVKYKLTHNRRGITLHNYDFSTESYYKILDCSFEKKSYYDSCTELSEINKVLYNEFASMALGVDC